MSEGHFRQRELFITSLINLFREAVSTSNDKNQGFNSSVEPLLHSF